MTTDILAGTYLPTRRSGSMVVSAEATLAEVPIKPVTPMSATAPSRKATRRLAQTAWVMSMMTVATCAQVVHNVWLTGHG